MPKSNVVMLEDGYSGNVPRKRTRKQKTEKIIKEKFQEMREGMILPITALNQHQKEYLDSLQKNTVTVGMGSAGSGKSFLAASVASNKYLRGEVNKIVVTRPIVQMGRSTGYWPGGIEEKLLPYLQPIFNTIKKRIGNSRFDAEFGKSILIQPMESIRGMSFERGTYLLVDEAQNMTVEEIRSVTTRLEEGAFIAFCGDCSQRDISGVSGIQYLANTIENHKLDGCGVVKFTTEDIVRSGLTRCFVQIYDAEGSASNVENDYRRGKYFE